jgi:hypothetical protein
MLELAAVVTPVAAVADSVASMAHHASSHVSTSHVPTVTARNLVCSISHCRSCCASSEHAAHARSMATTMTR